MPSGCTNPPYLLVKPSPVSRRWARVMAETHPCPRAGRKGVQTPFAWLSFIRGISPPGRVGPRCGYHAHVPHPSSAHAQYGTPRSKGSTGAGLFKVGSEWFPSAGLKFRQMDSGPLTHATRGRSGADRLTLTPIYCSDPSSHANGSAEILCGLPGSNG